MGLLQQASRVLFPIQVLFLLLLLFSFSFVEPGTSAYVVAVLTLIPVLLALVASAAIIYTGWSPFE